MTINEYVLGQCEQVTLKGTRCTRPVAKLGDHLCTQHGHTHSIELDEAKMVAHHLRDASSAMARAHAYASEEGGLTGYVRDMLYGLTSAVDALLGIVEQVAEAREVLDG